MTWKKRVGIGIFGFAIVVGWFVHRGEPGKLVQGPSPVVDPPAVSVQQLGANEAAESPPIASLQEKASTQDRSVALSDPINLPTLEQSLQNLQGYYVETRWLLDAGFSQERIDWLVRRKSELLAQREQEAVGRKQSGGPPDPSGGAWIIDDDLLLRDEIAEDEYVKYRQALRKAITVSVDQVLPGSYADQAGFMPGDQVVRYDGKRVFSDLELNSLARSGQGGDYAQVEVLRGDQTVMLFLPKGVTGFSRSPESRVNETVGRAIAKAREARAQLPEPNH